MWWCAATADTPHIHHKLPLLEQHCGRRGLEVEAQAATIMRYGCLQGHYSRTAATALLLLLLLLLLCGREGLDDEASSPRASLPRRGQKPTAKHEHRPFPLCLPVPTTLLLW